MKREKVVILSLTLIIFTLTIVRVVVANNISTNGLVLGDITAKNQIVARENMLIKEKVEELSSLNHIASVAAKLGFVGDTNVISLNSPLPLAKR